METQKSLLEGWMLITLIGCEHCIKVDDDLGKSVPELPLPENKLLPDVQGEPEVP